MLEASRRVKMYARLFNEGLGFATPFRASVCVKSKKMEQLNIRQIGACTSCDQRSQRGELDAFNVCSSRPFSLDETRLDKNRACNMVKQIVIGGQAGAAVGKGKHTGAERALDSAIGVG